MVLAPPHESVAPRDKSSARDGNFLGLEVDIPGMSVTVGIDHPHVGDLVIIYVAAKSAAGQ